MVEFPEGIWKPLGIAILSAQCRQWCSRCLCFCEPGRRDGDKAFMVDDDNVHMLGCSCANYGYQILTHDHKLNRISIVVSWISGNGSCCPKECDFRVVPHTQSFAGQLQVMVFNISFWQYDNCRSTVWNFIFCLAIISSAYISIHWQTGCWLCWLSRHWFVRKWHWWYNIINLVILIRSYSVMAWTSAFFFDRLWQGGFVLRRRCTLLISGCSANTKRV